MKPRPGLPLFAAGVTFAVHVLIAVFFEVPGTFAKYKLAAEQHLAGELPAERLVDLSPLYFEAAVAAARLARPDAVLLGLQILLIAVAAGFLAALLERRFGRGLALAGSAAFLLDRHVLVYERVLEPEAFRLFFVLGWLWFVERSGERPGWKSPLVAGVFAAASLATRPTFLPVFLLVPLYLRARGAGRWLWHSAWFGGPVVAVLLGLMLRAAAITGEATTPVMNPGTVFYEGNNPLSRGTSAIYPPVVLSLIGPSGTRPDVAHEHYRTVARAATGEELSIAEVNAYWSRLALGFIRAEPGRYLGLLRDKLLRVFHGYRWHDIALAWHYDQTLRLPWVPFSLLAALALLGMLAEARQPSRAFLFYALAGAQVAVMLVFYVSARQRLVLLPALLYFALAGVEWLDRQRRRSFPAVMVLLLLTVCFVLPNDLMRDDYYTKRGYVVAQARFAELREAARSEPVAAHADLVLDGMRHAPWIDWVPAYFPQEPRSLEERVAELLDAGLDLAVVFLRAGRLDDAEPLLETLVAEGREVYRGAQQPSDPRFYLARVAARRGEKDRAVGFLDEALERSPGNPFVLAELLALTDDPRYQEPLLGATSVIDAQYLLGRALLFHGRAAEAVAAFGFVVERLPQFRTGRIYLAAALGAAGRVDEGAAQYLEAVRREPDPLLLSSRISELFRRWAALHPGEPQVQLYAAHVLHEHGRFQEALTLLEGPGLQGTPGVAEKLRRLRQALAVSSQDD